MDAIAPETNFPKLSRYRIEKQIGSGGGGQVFKAWDEKLERDVAVKRIDRSVLPDGRSAAEEALHLSSLHHPNIVTIHDFVEDAEGHFVVLEYVKGETLADVIKRGAFPLEEFAMLAQQTLDALAAAHTQGLLHRDIKPDNIMVQWLPGGGFQIKVLDFGLSKIVAAPQSATCQHDGTYVGTIYTMAPEALQKAPLDVRSDLYSLGCVFYFTLTQHMPFTGNTVSDVVVSHLQHQVVPLEQYRPDLPPMVAQWVQQFIEVDPAQRFHSAKQALAVFARLLQQQREEASAPPAPASRPERASARPVAAAPAPSKGGAWMAWAAGFIVVAAAFGVWYVMGGWKPKASDPAAASTESATPAARPNAATPRPANSGLPDASAIAALGQGDSSPGTAPVPRTAVEAVPAPAASTPLPNVLPASTPLPNVLPASTPAVPHPVAATPAPVAPPAKGTPAPAGAGLLAASDLEGAKARLGTEVVLDGSVVSLSHAKTGDIHYLNFDRNYRNAVSLVFFASRNPDFTPEKLQAFVGKHIHVHGTIDQYKETLQIKVKGLDSIEIVN